MCTKTIACDVRHDVIGELEHDRDHFRAKSKSLRKQLKGEKELKYFDARVKMVEDAYNSAEYYLQIVREKEVLNDMAISAVELLELVNQDDPAPKDGE